jgi:hypothetical protein
LPVFSARRREVGHRVGQDEGPRPEAFHLLRQRCIGDDDQVAFSQRTAGQPRENRALAVERIDSSIVGIDDHFDPGKPAEARREVRKYDGRALHQHDRAACAE